MNGKLRVHFAPIRWSLALGITAASWLLPGSIPRLSAAELPSGATLTILVNPVQVASLGATDFVDALPGQSLQPGDVVRTGDTGIALLTFFDGSESQLAAGSQVQIEQADYTPAPHIALFQTSGVSINRVIPLPPGGSFRTDTPDATGLVRGTSYVVTVANDQDAVGTAMILLTDRDGHVGHLQVVPPVATTPTEKVPAEAIVHLVHAGDLGTTSVASGDRPTATHLDDTPLATLEQAAKNLHDAAGARTASDQARQTLRSVAPAPVAVTPNADPTDRPKPEMAESAATEAAVATPAPTQAAAATAAQTTASARSNDSDDATVVSKVSMPTPTRVDATPHVETTPRATAAPYVAATAVVARSTPPPTKAASAVLPSKTAAPAATGAAAWTNAGQQADRS